MPVHRWGGRESANLSKMTRPGVCSVCPRDAAALHLPFPISLHTRPHCPAGCVCRLSLGHLQSDGKIVSGPLETRPRLLRAAGRGARPPGALKSKKKGTVKRPRRARACMARLCRCRRALALILLRRPSLLGGLETDGFYHRANPRRKLRALRETAVISPPGRDKHTSAETPLLWAPRSTSCSALPVSHRLGTACRYFTTKSDQFALTKRQVVCVIRRTAECAQRLAADIGKRPHLTGPLRQQTFLLSAVFCYSLPA